MERKLTQERRGEIAQCLMHEGKVSATALARQYAVSTETIRKDLLWLEEQGLAQLLRRKLNEVRNAHYLL